MPLRRLTERNRDRLLLAWVIVFTVLTFYGIAGNRARAAEGQEAHDALCVLRADLDTRVRNGEALLEEHEGPLIFGIPRATIETSLAGQRKTLDSLSDLDCTPPPEEE